MSAARLSVVLVAAVLLSACSPLMSNDRIIENVKKCEEAGMRAHVIHSSNYSGRIVDIVCHPNEAVQ